MNALDIRKAVIAGMDSANRTVEEANALTALYKSGNLFSNYHDDKHDMACISDEIYGRVISVWLDGFVEPMQFMTNHGDDYDAQIALKDAISYCKEKYS